MTPSPDWLVDEPGRRARWTLVLAHGAGAGMDSPFMTEIAGHLAACGGRVVRFEFPYMAARRADGRRRPPNRLPVAAAAFAETAGAVHACWPDSPLALGGKSFGARAAVAAAAAAAPFAVLCLGYPFHAAGKAATSGPGNPRIAPLLAPPCPILIVQGERDALGPRAEVEALALPPPVELAWIEGGDHSLVPRPRRDADVARFEAAIRAAAFLSRLVP